MYVPLSLEVAPPNVAGRWLARPDFGPFKLIFRLDRFRSNTGLQFRGRFSIDGTQQRNRRIAMKLRTASIVLAAWPLLSWTPAFADQPADLNQVIDRIVAQEKQLLTILHGDHPIAETYVQELKRDE